ncbi:MAG: hypothetical protein COY66_02470 [Candidatus Kerfeldbacteria bacterium CG_4_10_14_0_8_um_filter_42_10]|uniref:Aminoglycoside phosphotransferase domain-containing protein n=1 Tax=Candidatus Kerfeldbacteria bacterium CG_4_10_14_0_8_um_filter_42_10 TaxID=2014248 RepID=A0A2M7RK94_9BACT|nr:MAG: hypothetical protein COY66_02470 [Candidatus Kerfeldbacteria bacterium CG_4_10_14_0_8_um_filter_42_10]
MRKENPKIKKQRLQAAQDAINDILLKEGYRIIKELKYGPRFLLAEVTKRNQRALLKVCLFTNTLDKRTNLKFSREILFLKFLARSKYRFLKKSVPKIYASGLVPRTWYIREYWPGKTQNVEGGDIRFKPSFFNKDNLDWVFKFFSALQSIKKKELPAELRKLLHRSYNFNRQLWRYLEPHFELIEGYLRQPGVTQQFRRTIKEYIPAYNRATQVLSHQEPYSAHFIKNDGGFTLIDWENINWVNPVHDPVALWMRAYDHPAWQHQLYLKFKRHYRNLRQFDELWIIETFTQSCFNIVSYYFHHDTEDLQGLAMFSEKKIKEILSHKPETLF